MSTLASMKPANSIQPTQWLMPGLIPIGELMLLDGPAGVGKSLVTAGLAAIVATHPELNKPGSILYLTSPQQSELTIEFLANQNPNYDHIHRLNYEPDPEAIANHTTMAFHLFNTIQTALLEHHPRLFIIDSLEELLEPGGETDGKTLHELWEKLRTLAKLHQCTLLIPRKNGLHENRQYGPFARFGSEAARFALTLGWHPTDPCKRIITLAKHQRGPVGEQTHVHIKHDGKVAMNYTDAHEHVRPAKSPATWQPDPIHAQEDTDILNIVEGQMMGLPRSIIELEKVVTSTGYSKQDFKRAVSKAKLEGRFKGVEWFCIPSPQMLFRADRIRARMKEQTNANAIQDSALSTENSANPPENHARTQGKAADQSTQQPGRLIKPITPTNVRQAG